METLDCIRNVFTLEQIQTYFTDDDTEKGFSTLLKTMFNNLDTTQHTNFDENVRSSLSEAPRVLLPILTELLRTFRNYREP